jgi:hypothetical protein
MFLRRLSYIIALGIAFYIGLFTIHKIFPYIGVGSQIVTDEKLHFVNTESIFPPNAKRRLVIFGDSRVLSGFIPALFDELSRGTIYSYNLAIPDNQMFIPLMENIINKKQIPTDIFITIPWQELPKKNPLMFIDNDNEIIKKLVPFRYLIRNLVIFWHRSRYRGGIRKLYDEGKHSAKEVLENRGYYFIAGQSFYKNDELPDDFSFISDQPDKFYFRGVPPKNELYKQLTQMLEAHSINAYFVPIYARIGAYKPNPEPNVEFTQAFENNSRIQVIGPDYFSFPNKLFSDPVHLNRNGAKVYTTKLWELYSKHLQNSISTH